MQAVTRAQMRDIMPDITIPTGLLPYLLAGGMILLILLGILLYYYRKNRPQPTAQERALQRLQALDLQGAVDAALLYRFSIEAQRYLDGREDPAFAALQEALLPYKYQVAAPEPDTALIQRIRRYIEGLS